MGMFTSVYVPHPDKPDEELEIQIKTGDDQCECYRVGDEVDWWVDENHVGRSRLLDDVYDGYSGKAVCDDKHDWWVCVKDHRIVEVVPQVRQAWPEGETPPHVAQAAALRARHKIPEQPPRELWTEAAWEQHEEAEQVRGEEFERYRQAYNVGRRGRLPPEGRDQPLNESFFEKLQESDYGPSQAAMFLTFYTRKRMREPSFTRQVMPGFEEPTAFDRPDGVILRKGETYDHFGRPVVLDRIYDNGNMGVTHLKGTHCIVPPGELQPVEEADANSDQDAE